MIAFNEPQWATSPARPGIGIVIGEFVLIPTTGPNGAPRIWIQNAAGEGGEFETAKLEAVLRTFFSREF